MRGGFYLEAFWSFFKIGAFTIGGGMAMVPLIQDELVVRKKWMSGEDFLDLLALSQSLPGILAVNIAIYTGYRLRGIRGSLVTTLASVLPSFVLILLLAMFFAGARDNEVIARLFRGIRPAVVALIAVPTYRLGRACGITWRNVWIPVLGAVFIYFLGCSPVWIIIAAALGGILFHLCPIRGKDSESGKGGKRP